MIRAAGLAAAIVLCFRKNRAILQQKAQDTAAKLSEDKRVHHTNKESTLPRATVYTWRLSTLALL